MLYELIISHFVFDYGYMLTPSMINAKSKGWPIGPIANHALLHTLGVAAILLLHSVPIPVIIGLALFEFVTHLIIDISKGRLEAKFPSLKDAKNPWHWHIFQIDQFIHLSVMFAIADIANKFLITSQVADVVDAIQNMGRVLIP